ncbi:MAG: acyltransferase family protein [Congregibacter sp.]
MAGNQQKYIPVIDGLRALAVLSVVVFHAFPNVISGGFIGVDIFFVISGYLITRIIYSDVLNERFSFFDFYLRRARRLFPALILVLGAVLIFGYVCLFPDELMSVSRHTMGGAAFVANFVFYTESGYFDVDAIEKPLLHLWSLSVEEQFYIAWPLLLLAVLSARLNLIFVTSLVVLASLFAGISLLNVDPPAAFYLPYGRFAELGCGSLLGVCSMKPNIVRWQGWEVADNWAWRLIFDGKNYERGRFRYIQELCALSGLTLLGWGFFSLNKETPFPGVAVFAPVFGAVLIILSSRSSVLAKHALGNKAMVAIGLVSYPLYLWHWPLLSFLHILSGGEPTPSMKIGVVLLAIILSAVTYMLFEKKLRRRGRPTALILSLAMLSIFSSAWFIEKSNGIPERIANPFTKIEKGYHSCRKKGREAVQFCQVGNRSAKRKMLVYGDSHVLHLTQAIDDRLGESYSIDIVSYGSCFFGGDLEILSSDPLRREPCSEAQALVRKAIDSKTFDVIVTAQRWHGYSLRSEQEFEKVIRDRVNSHIGEGEKLFILGSTSNVRLGCEKQKFRPFAIGSDCYSDDDTYESVQNFWKAAQQFESSGVNFIFPHKILCGEKRCETAEQNGEVLYFDNHHLSAKGSALVVEKIAERLSS